jgi:hypothetical protein
MFKTCTKSHTLIFLKLPNIEKAFRIAKVIVYVIDESEHEVFFAGKQTIWT